MSLPTFRLTLEEADLRWFDRHLGTDRCFPAMLQVGDSRCPVYIGYRGRYSRHFRKPSYDIWFGAERPPDLGPALHLNAAYRDPSLFRGRLSFHVFEQLGVAVPRCQHVWLTCNDEDFGVYTAVEAVDAHWLQRFGNPEESIYYAVGSKGNFGQLDLSTGRPKRSLVMGYEKRHPANDDFSDLEQLILAVTMPDPETFETAIADVVDVENCLRWLIGIEFVGHTDGIVQNYALYKSNAGLWQFSPWDLDGTWGRYPSGEVVSARRMRAGTGEDNYLLVRLLRSRRWRARYLELWRELLPTALSADRLDGAIEALYDEIRADVLWDDSKRHSDSTFRREPARLRRYLRERREFLEECLGL